MRPVQATIHVIIAIVVLCFCPLSIDAFKSTILARLSRRFSRASTRLAAMQGSVFIATSLDGFIATEDGDTSFLEDVPKLEDGNDMGFSAFVASVDAMIMGRNTFEKVLSFGQEVWPYGDLKVVVWSRGDVQIPDYRKATVTSSSMSPVNLFATLEKQGHKRAYIDGGLTVRKFLDAGLVTEITLTTAPVLLGSGIRLFGDGKKIKLNHLETTSYKNGMVSSKYQVL